VSRVPPTPVPTGAALAGTLGFEILELGDGHARGRVEVTDRLKQPAGLVHGGVFAAFAESLASEATSVAVRDAGDVAIGLSNHTSFVRPVSEGWVTADARCRHRGRTTWVWDVDLADGEGRLCAIARVTLAVRPAPD
jgi:1,4-dihydroxy-2-naphthoyl-CoA hydrolase